MAERAVIIDTDPGQDDAAAIMLALASPEIDIIGITAVAGNVPLALTSRNVRVICELCGRTDVPVFAGAQQPLTRPLVTAEHVHGGTGLDGTHVDEPTMPLSSSSHAAGFIVETLMEAPAGSVTLCTLGPLTNIALALAAEPRIAGRIGEIVMMGGAYFEVGNITPAAEFNIFVDPEAAAAVFACGAPITMMPLDVTHKLLTTTARLDAIKRIGTRPAVALAEMLAFFERFDEDKYGTDGGPLHDPSVIAYLIAPQLFSGRRCNVEIETVSELTRGMTVVDWWRVTKRPINAYVLGAVDADGFFRLLTERLARL